MRRWLLVTWLAACSSSGGPDNTPPEATLAAPDVVDVGAAARLDASDSTDADGVIVAYRFQFADGTPEVVSPAPSIDHVFPRGGRYDVAVIVVDDGGAEARASATVTAVESPPEECEPPLTRCGVECVDLRSDPDHCGGCFDGCDPGESCEESICTPAPVGPGTIVEELASPWAGELALGLTHDGTWFWATIGGTELLLFDLDGETLGGIAIEAGFLSYGLAAVTQPAALILAGLVDANLPELRPDLYVLTTGGFPVTIFEDLGGGMTTDGQSLFVWWNDTSELARIDESGNVVDVTSISIPGVDMVFTDLAVAPDGGIWAVRPALEGGDAEMVKLDPETGELLARPDFPDPEGLGGVVVVGDSLFGIGRSAVYRMIP